MSQRLDHTTVLAYWSEHRQQLRQSEDQRAVLTNYLLLMTAGLSGFIVQQHFATRTLPVAILIVGTGLYGTLTAAKYHERATYHLSQARALTRILHQLGALPDDAQLDDYRNQHYSAYPHLYKIRLHYLWTGLHLAIALYGIALIFIIFSR